jgi:hypothetical protein
MFPNVPVIPIPKSGLVDWNVTDKFQHTTEHINYITANAAKIEQHGRWIITLDQQR